MKKDELVRRLTYIAENVEIFGEANLGREIDREVTHYLKEKYPLLVAEGEDVTLCMDDYFPKCDGSKTHAMQLSTILDIDAVQQAIDGCACHSEQYKKTPDYAKMKPTGCDHCSETRSKRLTKERFT